MIALQVERVLARPELIESVFKHLQPDDKGSARLVCRTVREGSMSLLKKIDISLSCVTGFTHAQAMRLGRMRHLQHLHLRITDSHPGGPFPDDAAALLRSVMGAVRWFDEQKSALVVEATPVFTVPLSIAVQHTRGTGTTLIVSPDVRAAPLLRIHPRLPNPVLMLATTTLQNHIGMHWGLRKVVLTGYAPDRMTPALLDERALSPFGSDLMPNLASLTLMFGPNIALDLEEDIGTDLSQLRKLVLTQFDLLETGLGGLMDAAPGLVNLTVTSRHLLAIPDRQPAPWTNMRKMHLSVMGRVTPTDSIGYRHEDFVFPGDQSDTQPSSQTKMCRTL